MACPDELTLDLWLANALPACEASSVAAHVRTCDACAAALQHAQSFGAELHHALALDATERGYLAELQLAAPWQARAATDPAWGWVVVAAVVASFIAWLAAAPLVGSIVGLAAQIGIATVLLNAALVLAFGAGQALFDLIRNPALGWSQPLLALLALLLLVWPRELIPQRSTQL
jgi:hypothetical protein